jgi:hypothetical protein
MSWRGLPCYCHAHGLKRELAVPGVGAVGRARAVLRRNSLELAHTVTHV